MTNDYHKFIKKIVRLENLKLLGLNINSNKKINLSTKTKDERRFMLI